MRIPVNDIDRIVIETASQPTSMRVIHRPSQRWPILGMTLAIFGLATFESGGVACLLD